MIFYCFVFETKHFVKVLIVVLH